MATVAPIDIQSIKLPGPAAAPFEAGPAPQLQWLKIADLVVDSSYQRGADSRTSRHNIAKIAQQFRWSMFSPVIVSPVAGGRYAIIDGQHRTTAAALVGFETVPCQVVMATPGEQAKAFTAINGNVTKMHGMAIHKAAVAAGDRDALRIERVAAAARVKILAYPKAELNQDPGETMAIRALLDCVISHGDATVILALRCIRETSNDACGMLLADIIRAICAAIELARVRSSSLDDAAILDRFNRIRVIRELDKARRAERKPGVKPGVTIWRQLSLQLVEQVVSP